jgi:predicted ATP-grasp superfamily ATP-dependent carboligase
VLELTRKLGRALEYQGPANIEFRWDYRDETYKYIELNPRVGGNVEFDDATGVPTVWNTYRAAIGDAEASGLKQRDNVFFLDLGPDLISRISDGEPLAAILWSYVKVVFRRRKGRYFALDDPVPGLVAAGRFTRRLRQALLRRCAALLRGEAGWSA